MYIKSNSRIKNGKTYKTHYLVEGYRDENNKVKHKYLSNLSPLPEKHIEVLKKLLKQNDFDIEEPNTKKLEVICSKQYGNIAVFNKIFDEYFKGIFEEKYISKIKAIVINRIFEPKSKNGLNNWLKLVDFPVITNKNTIYDTIDYLNSNHVKIENKLFQKTKDQNCDLLLYDITSTYFEGDKCEIAKYGYSRDNRGDRKQVNIGLVTNSVGCPITTEVIEGNINDKSTVKDKVDKLKQRFGIKQVTFIFDRGMKSKVNLEYIQEQGFEYITALDHAELKEKAIKNQNIMQGLFDKDNLAEYDIDGKKYVLSYNEKKAYTDKNDRLLLIDRTKKKLKKIQNLKRDYTVQQMQDKISRIIDKDKCSKYIDYEIQEINKDGKIYGKLEFVNNDEIIKRDELYDGFYMVESTVTNLNKEELESKYKSLQLVERGFDDVKNLIELRPVFHWKTHRVKGHILACFLSYYLLFQFKQKIQDLLKNNTLDSLLTELKCISLVYMNFKGSVIKKVSKLSDIQNDLLNRFGCSLLS